MKISINPLTGLEREIVIEVPAEELEAKYQAKLKQAAKNIKMPGFRPGKVPAKVVEQRYGEGLVQDAAAELMDESFRKAIVDEKLKIAGEPSVSDRTVERNKPLEFKLKVEVYPEIELKDLAGQKIEKATAEVADSDIQDMLDKLRGQHKEWEVVERKSKDGDRIIIDFEGFIDGEAFPGGEAEEFALELGAGNMIPGFEDQLVGVKADDETTITVTFPEEYHAKELAGKPAEFKIKVHKVEESKLPELSDEFAVKLGIAEGGLEKLKEQIKTSMDRELKQAKQTQLKQAVMDKLIELNKIDVPEATVANEIKHMQDMTRQRMAQQMGGQADLAKMELPADLYREDALRRVALGLLLGEVISKFELKPDADLVRGKVEDLSANYQDPEQVVQYYYQNKQMLAEIEALVLEEQAVEKLLENATVTEKASSYQDLLNPPQQEG